MATCVASNTISFTGTTVTANFTLASGSHFSGTLLGVTATLNSNVCTTSGIDGGTVGATIPLSADLQGNRLECDGSNGTTTLTGAYTVSKTTVKAAMSGTCKIASVLPSQTTTEIITFDVTHRYPDEHQSHDSRYAQWVLYSRLAVIRHAAVRSRRL